MKKYSKADGRLTGKARAYHKLLAKIHRAESGHADSEVELSQKTGLIKAEFSDISIPVYSWKRIDNDFILIGYNSAAKNFPLLRISDCKGKRLREVFADYRDILDDFNGCLAEKKPVTREMIYESGDAGKSRTLLLTYIPLPQEIIRVHVEDITERRGARQQLDFSFESVKLISSISTGLINLEPRRFKSVIAKSLRKITEFTNAEKCFLALFSDGRVRLGDVHLWPTGKASRIKLDADGLSLEAFPWAFEKLKKLENIRIFNLKDLPPLAKAEKELIRSLNVSSLITVPVEREGCLIGCLGLMSSPDQKVWDDDFMALLRMLGLSFAAAYERIRLEKRLLKSERKYRLLIENAAEAISLVSETGRYLQMNKTAAEYLRGQPEEFVGKTVWELFPKEIADKRMESIRKAIEGGNNWIGDERILIGGEERWFKVGIYPIRVPGDRIFAAQIIARDITENHQIEIRDLAKFTLLNRLRNAEGIDECLRYGCETIYEAELFKRAVLIMYGEAGQIACKGWFGIDDDSAKSLEKFLPPSRDFANRALQRKNRIGRSYLIPGETPSDLDRPRKHARQATGRADHDRVWEKGYRLFVPMLGKKSKFEGWLSVNTPFSGKIPSLDQVAFLEEVVDTVAQQVYQIQNRERLELERQALEEKNIALKEVLTHIEEEKMGIKQRITESIDHTLLPILSKLRGESGAMSSTYVDLLKSGLIDLASSAGGFQHVYSKLSPRERDICMMIKDFATNKEIARTLNIKVGTVRKHRERIRRKLGLTNRKVNLAAYLNNV